MTIHSDLLFIFLCKKWAFQHKGQDLSHLDLQFPIFYERNTQLEKGGVYIIRSHDIPTTVEVPCLFISIGSIPLGIWDDWYGELFYLPDSHCDILSVMNTVLQVFQQIFRWQKDLEHILNESCNIQEMVNVTIPLLDNRICVIDFEFRILGYWEREHTSPKNYVVNRNNTNWISTVITSSFAKDYQKWKMEKKPFFAQSQDGSILRNNYCINLFQSNEYIGACSLTEDGKTFSDSDIMLFQYFARYIQQAIVIQSNQIDSPFVSMKTIFSEMLQNLPVSQQSVEQALKHIGEEKDVTTQNQFWVCSVIRSMNRKKTLPAGYLCSTLENILPNSVAFVYNEDLVVFSKVKESASICEELRSLLIPYMKDMNFHAGVSDPFSDIYKARTFYLQALTILEDSPVQTAGVIIFSEFLLDYMIQNCSGRFSPETLLPSGLKQLRNLSSTVDYWDTLQRYLDNECNASKTAQEMFLHRSSLLPRLEKIRHYVSLDTPEQRLLLRICMRAFDKMNQ